MEESAGGSSSLGVSGEDVILAALLVLGRGEPLRLQIEHRAIAAAERHELFVRSELHDFPVLEDTDAVRVANRRKAV